MNPLGASRITCDGTGAEPVKRTSFDPGSGPGTTYRRGMRLTRGTAAIAVATLSLSLGASMSGAQADTIPTVHFRDLGSGQSTLQYGEAFGVWSCWANPKLNVSLYAMDADGAWQTVSTDNSLTKDPTNCNVAGLPYRAVNAWTVNMKGSQASGVQRGVIVLGLGTKPIAPTSAFALAQTRQVPGGAGKNLQWADLSAGKVALPLGSSVSVTYPGCGANNLYALDSTGLLGSWKQVATDCDTSWKVKSPGSQGLGTQTGLTLLAAGSAKPQYTYGLAKVTQ